MYRVLYRKWRPKTFDDVLGQEHVTTTLLNELSAGRLNHAYLFTGSRGTGKTTCAKILAKAVNCLNPQNGNPCGKCEICRGIEDGGVLDIIEMDAASNRKIDDIRQIVDEVQFKPERCKYRVYIIDEVHMLTTEAFNALLKTLEEPPSHVIFILATTEVHKLPQTILSRCQRFDFHRIAPEAIVKRVLYVAEREQVSVTEDAAMLIASVADGAMRDALSLLDRCIAISSEIDDAVVRSAAGLAEKTYLFDLADCVINKNTAKALSTVDRLYSESKDMARLCDELLAHFRALMLIKSVKNPLKIIIMSQAEFERALTQSDYLSLADIVYYMDVLSRTYQRMGKGTGDRTEFEMAIVKLTSAQLDGTVEALTARVTALEKAVKSGLAVKTQELPKPQSEEKSEPQPVPTADDIPAVTAPKEPVQSEPVKPKSAAEQNVAKAPASQARPDVESIYANAKPFPDWQEVVNNMKSVSVSVAAAFANSSAYVSGKYLLIDSETDSAFVQLRNAEKKEKIRRVIFETTGVHYNLGPYKRPEKKQKQTDPLDALAKAAEDSGAQVEVV